MNRIKHIDEGDRMSDKREEKLTRALLAVLHGIIFLKFHLFGGYVANDRVLRAHCMT